MRSGRKKGHYTLIKIVLVLLALSATASCRIELVTKTAEEATALTTLARLALTLVLALALLIVVSAGDLADVVLEKVHFGWECKVIGGLVGGLGIYRRG